MQEVIRMISISQRMLAGILAAVLLLPFAALASDSNNANGPANSTPASETTATSAPGPAPAPAPAVGLNPMADPLLQLLVSKGILSSGEVNSLAAAPAN